MPTDSSSSTLTPTTTTTAMTTTTTTTTTTPLKSCLRSESPVRKTQGDSLKVTFPKSDDELNSVKEFETEPEHEPEAEGGQESIAPTDDDEGDEELADLEWEWGSIDKVEMRNDDEGRCKQAHRGRKKQMQDLKEAEKKEKDNEGDSLAWCPYKPN